jgi:hypothetical protein
MSLGSECVVIGSLNLGNRNCLVLLFSECSPTETAGSSTWIWKSCSLGARFFQDPQSAKLRPRDRDLGNRKCAKSLAARPATTGGRSRVHSNQQPKRYTRNNKQDTRIFAWSRSRKKIKAYPSLSLPLPTPSSPFTSWSFPFPLMSLLSASPLRSFPVAVAMLSTLFVYIFTHPSKVQPARWILTPSPSFRLTCHENNQ